MVENVTAQRSMHTPPHSQTAAVRSARSVAGEGGAKGEPEGDPVKAIKQAKADIRRMRGDAAASRVECLRSKLQWLKMFAGGDPKVIAREAARLARELAGAAQEVRGAGAGATPSQVAGPGVNEGEGVVSTAVPAPPRRTPAELRQELRTLYHRTKGLLERQRRRAAEQERQDREYTALAVSVHQAGGAVLAPPGAEAVQPGPLSVVV